MHTVWTWQRTLAMVGITALGAGSPLWVSCGGGAPTAFQVDTPEVGQTSQETDNNADLLTGAGDELTTQGNFTLAVPETRNQSLSTSDGTNNAFRQGFFHDRWNLNLGSFGTGSTIVVTMTSGAFDTYLQLVDTSTTPPTLLDANDDFNGTNSQITFVVEAGKVYQIRATSFSQGATGQYQIVTQGEAFVPGRRPNDPRYGEQWGFENVRMPVIWNNTTQPRATNPVIVSVLDTGIHANHPDLPAKPSVNARILNSGANVAKSTNAANTPSAESHHGTHVAGTIAALSNNGNGVAGMLWGGRTFLPVTLQSVRVLQGVGSGSGTFFDIVQGIYYAAGLQTSVGIRNQNPAQVINMSLGGGGFCTSALEAAIRAATQAGTSVVVAAGNSATSSPFQPASCPSVTLTVGATTQANQLASFSNFSYNDISAPGVDILSTWRNPNYEFLSGTSMASPHVAGAAAYLLARNPNLTPNQIRGLLLNSAASFNDPRMGVGILRLPGAFTSAMNPRSLSEMDAKVALPMTKAVAARGDIAPDTDFVPGEIIVTYAALGKSIDRVDGQSLRTVAAPVLPEQPALVQLVGTQSLSPAALKQQTLKTIQQLLQSPDVVDAHPNYIFSTDF
ncbi:MAG: hypothetical protein OHK0012_03840 [Synechococcales cyanobacterium]